MDSFPLLQQMIQSESLCEAEGTESSGERIPVSFPTYTR